LNPSFGCASFKIVFEEDCHMPGRAALTGIDAAKADIASVRMNETPAGVGGTGEYSAIGGAGRKGADGDGSLSEPMYTRIDAEHSSEGMATKGEQGVGYGVGKTFGGASRRAED
jgi:hypothetical protein